MGFGDFMGLGDLVSGVLNFFPNLVNAGSSVIGAFDQMKTNDLNYKLQKDQYSYQKLLQRIMFGREDTAVRRRVADLKAAGLSPTLAAGSAASAGPVVSTSAPQRNSDLSAYLTLANIGTMLANQQKAQTEADIARQSLAQAKIQTHASALSNELLRNRVVLSNLDKKYYLNKGVAPIEVNQDWQQRVVNLLYPKLEDWMFGNEDEKKKGWISSLLENPNTIDTSGYRTFDKQIPRVKLSSGDTLNDYEYDILKKKGLLDTFFEKGWTTYLKAVVHGGK